MKPVTLDPHKFFRRLPLAPHQMRDRLTRIEDAIVLCHLGVARIAREDWRLTIDGLVARPRTFTFDDLSGYPRTELTSVHQCAGSPMQPTQPSQRACNVIWAGVRLADLVSRCEPSPATAYIWATGADFGEFGGVRVNAYVKDFPIKRVRSDVLVAYEMNGAPLLPEHGFPARLVIPGFYGTNSVKWLTGLTLAERRASSPFTTRWYNDPVPGIDGRVSGTTTPVWSIAPQSVIVAPEPNEQIGASGEIEIWGWAWADEGVHEVEITVDDGKTWRPATLEPASGRAWQRFSFVWSAKQHGVAILASRAISTSGHAQPIADRRNAIYRVAVAVS